MLQIARENPSYGYDCIGGALANVGHQAADLTVGNILNRHGPGPAPEHHPNTTWAAFIRRHKDLLWATDFLTTGVWMPTGPTTF